MRLASFALAGALSIAATQAFADDVMAMTFGNTITSKDQATGAVATLYFNQDGTFTQQGTMNAKPYQAGGKWVEQDGGKTLCLTPDAPPNAPKAPPPSCSPLEAHKIGDTWIVTNDQKQSFDVTLSAGR
jgi:hypothetical protein